MPIHFTDSPARNSLPVHCVRSGKLEASGLDGPTLSWAKANGFSGEAGKVLIIAGPDGAIAGALFGLGLESGGFAPLGTGALAKALPEGDWHFAAAPDAPDLAAIGLALGAYGFTRYGKKAGKTLGFALPEGAEADHVARVTEAVAMVRDLINTPTNDMGPADLEAAARALAGRHGADFAVTTGDALVAQNFPMIHAVGRASTEAPRLIDMVWGPQDAPKVTLVGKGVCFDTGGLDIKPPSSMLLMKKDMGGAANVLGLASMLMAGGRNIRLRVLIPAVENAISGNAFRPGDVLRSRKGITVEIGNTDAEGRLILADALALADEEAPDLLIDMATLTGAARVALGPDLPPFFCDDDSFCAEMMEAALAHADPVWRLPLWAPYESKLSSRIADTNNVTTDGFAGSITAALFLKKFVGKAKNWAHFDVFGWCPVEKPHCPVGGEAQAIRALERLISTRYG